MSQFSATKIDIVFFRMPMSVTITVNDGKTTYGSTDSLILAEMFDKILNNARQDSEVMLTYVNNAIVGTPNYSAAKLPPKGQGSTSVIEIFMKYFPRDATPFSVYARDTQNPASLYRNKNQSTTILEELFAKILNAINGQDITLTINAVGLIVDSPP